jgi:hypothetical protein
VHFFNGIFLPRQEIPASAGNYLPDGQEMFPAEDSVLYTRTVFQNNPIQAR